MTHIVFLDQPPLLWSVINMIIRVGPLVATQLVVNFPTARNGSIALAWGLIPVAATAIIIIIRVAPTFFNIVARLGCRICVFWIMPSLVIRMLGFRSMHVTRLKILVVSRRRCLAVTARIPFGTTIVVPFTIVRGRRNSF